MAAVFIVGIKKVERCGPTLFADCAVLFRQCVIAHMILQDGIAIGDILAALEAARLGC